MIIALPEYRCAVVVNVWLVEVQHLTARIATVNLIA